MGEGDDWREVVLHAMLRIALWVVPVTALVAIALRPPPHLDGSAVSALLCVVVFLVLGTRGTLPYRVRAWGTLAGLSMPAVFTATASGLSPGGAVCSVTCVVFAAIFLGRGAMLLVLSAVPALYLIVGAKVAGGAPLPRVGDLDPLDYQNWIRAGFVQAGLSFLLGSAILFVIRQVEAGRERAAGAAEELRIAYLQLVRLHRRLESTKDDERRHLSRELHDELGQSLTALKLRLQTLARNAPTGGTAPFEDSIALVDDLVRRVRALAVDLRPPLLDELGLEAALHALVEEQARLAGVSIALEATGLSERLIPEVEMTCYRVVQEAVTNVVRHAMARQVSVTVARRADQVELRILDDGCGMSAHDVAMYGRTGHLGLVGMRERTRALGGVIRLVSPPETQPSGTLVHVTLPAQPAGLSGDETSTSPEP
jgi:signal transduction histidine kinase